MDRVYYSVIRIERHGSTNRTFVCDLTEGGDKITDNKANADFIAQQLHARYGNSTTAYVVIERK